MYEHTRFSGSRRRLGLRLAVAALVLAFVPVVGEAATTETFTYTGHCDDIVLFVSLDPTVVRQYVPEPPYAPLTDASGKDEAAVTVCNASNLALDGTPLPPAVLSDFILAISDPTGGSGESWYALWQIGNSDSLRAQQAGLGEFGASVPGMTFTSAPGSVPNLTVSSDAVPWSYSPYSQTATSTNSPPQMLTKANTFYQVGSKGTIVITNAFLNETLDPLQGHVHADAASPLAQLMGGTDQDGAGLLLHIDFTQTETLQSPGADVPEWPAGGLALSFGIVTAALSLHAVGIRRQSRRRSRVHDQV